MSARDLMNNFFPNKTEEQIMNAGYNHKIKKTIEYLDLKRIEVGIENLKLVGDNTGSNNINWVERITINCEICGKEIVRTEARLNNTNYCSRECLNKSKIGNFTLDKNPNWKGGISPLVAYGRSNIIEWKKDSMFYSGYKCVLSGSKNFAIHHITSFDTIFEEVINDIGMAIKNTISEYTDDELNTFVNTLKIKHTEYGVGVCLDYDLHNLFHMIYGRGSNTKEQFNEFVMRYKNGEFGVKG